MASEMEAEVTELPQVEPSSSGNNKQGALHLVTKRCLDGTDEVSVTWFSDRMPPQPGGDKARYKLQEYPELRSALSDTAVDAIKKLGFGVFLEIDMHKLSDRNFPIWLASFFRPAKCRNEEAVVFILDESCPKPLTGHGVELLLGLPTGNQIVPEDLQNPTPPDEARDAFKNALETASQKNTKWTMNHVIKACQQAKDDHMLQVRLFLAAIFEFAIFTSSSNYLSSENQSRVFDIQKLVETNWCEELIVHMQKCLKTYDATSRVNSPVTFSLFCIENMDCDLPEDLKTLRLKYYSEGVFGDIVTAFKQGVKLKDWKNTVFGRNNIEEFQANEIKYAENYKETIKKRNLAKLDKDPPVPKKRPRRDTDDNNKHDQFFHADIDRDTLDFYKKYVLEKTRDKIVLNILNHEVSELNYVECFKLKGYMHTSIMFMRCALWNEEWKEKSIDKFIVPHKAMLELVNPKEETRFLAAELRANLIFIPIVHDHHWFLMVISRNKKTIYTLDSFPSPSREADICRNLTTLKNLLGSNYKSEVLEVLRQKNNYDCGFHVLLYINGFDDEKTEQICHVNKDMVDKFRIETSVYLRRHKLNKPDEVIIVSNDDEVKVLEDTFSYGNCNFNTALCGEWEDPLSSSPLFMYRSNDNMNFDIHPDSNILDDDDNNKESNEDGKKENGNPNISDDDHNNKESNEDGKKENGNPMAEDRKTIGDDPKNPESSVGGKTKDSKVEEMLGGKKTDNTMAGDGKTKDSKVAGKPRVKQHYGRDRTKRSQKEQQLDTPGNTSQNEQQLVTSEVMKSRSERQLMPCPPSSSDLHEKRSHPHFQFELLENAYKLAIDYKEQVILMHHLNNSWNISMTGPQLEKCLQGGQDARDLILILMEILSPKQNGMKRIFASPLDKDDESLEKMIPCALRSLNDRANLTNTIIYFLVFFSGEWIVVCFVFQESKNQIHVYCHKDSYEEARKFSLYLKKIVCKFFIKAKRIMAQERVASTTSTIKANDSAVASMYFLEYFFSARALNKFAKFETESDELRDAFMKAVKFEYVRYILVNKGNKAKVPDSVKLLK